MLSTPDEVRGFLRMCLDPGLGRDRRTPTELTVVMPDWLLGHLAEHAPHLAALHADVTVAEELAAEARVSYAEALLAWITELPTQRAMAAASPDFPTTFDQRDGD
ncbi:hypothetical protein [Actinacidiphila acididurans]|uniref:Uncharacterized protein n=1 Tax=Actinacidiphila acididurans TaxID=2784346 RepID=A0ABS2TTS9_9ACTN|nr:hypothetical protein [Actinacidiphila acididurans]MBM9506734.1 hypothetical protein [Actinacidiphila acididurans]